MIGDEPTASRRPADQRAAVEKVEAHVGDALERGAELVAGGERLEGQFFPPSIP